MLEENQIVRTLGGNLKIARTKKGMSIKELAEAIDVTAPYLVRIENNLINNIGIITFSKVCYALDLSDTQVLDIIKFFK
ncbi:helix-turn-helix transcriptional regulator [Psychrobacillus sp. FSL K6-4046]|uniref:helix-turn-helix transcriptional regulator n=1 Tax=Psychrobacillus sp. FSL K6-4046 TaxID=2921550 RepID=UPI00315A33A0